VPVALGHNSRHFQILKYTFHYNNSTRIVDPWQNMEQELKKETSIISNNETSRYIMKKVYLDAN
jgi:hypothetical protein